MARTSEYTKLINRVKELEAALAPFAGAAEGFDEGEGGHPRTDVILIGPNDGKRLLTTGDLFDARKVWLNA